MCDGAIINDLSFNTSLARARAGGAPDDDDTKTGWRSFSERRADAWEMKECVRMRLGFNSSLTHSYSLTSALMWFSVCVWVKQWKDYSGNIHISQNWDMCGHTPSHLHTGVAEALSLTLRPYKFSICSKFISVLSCSSMLSPDAGVFECLRAGPGSAHPPCLSIRCVQLGSDLKVSALDHLWSSTVHVLLMTLIYHSSCQ